MKQLAEQYYIYLFRVKKTQQVIYVGSTKQIGARLNEHRRGFKDPKHEMPIHTYMKENNLKLFDDVEVVIVEYWSKTTKEHALEVEAEYYYKYKDTVKNTRPAEQRSGIFSSRNKPIKCLNDNKIYASIREASRTYDLDRITIANHLNKGTKLKSGLIFMYLDESQNNLDRKLYVVYCVEDNRYFIHYTDCEKFYGIPHGQLSSKYLRGDKKECMYQGKTFRKCND